MPQKGRRKGTSFRVGRVRGYLRGRVWYLQFYESGRRKRPRVETDRAAARKVAAEVNAQLELGAPSGLSFERVTIAGLRRRWLEHHENVRRSSVHTIRRYRAATDHLLLPDDHSSWPRATAADPVGTALTCARCWRKRAGRGAAG